MSSQPTQGERIEQLEALLKRALPLIPRSFISFASSSDPMLIRNNECWALIRDIKDALSTNEQNETGV